MKEHKSIQPVEIFATGLNPISIDGEYFTTTTDSWFPLWSYITIVCEDFLSEDEEQIGFYPKQLRSQIPQDISIKMARALFSEIENGNAKAFGESTFPNGDFTFSVDELSKFAHFCGLSGGFKLS
jgi:hypothetical protein